MARTLDWAMLGAAIGCAVWAFSLHRAERERAIQDHERQVQISQLREELSALQNDTVSRARLATRLLKTSVAGGQANDSVAEDEEPVPEAGEAAEQGSEERKEPEMSDEEMKAVVLASVHSVFDAEPSDPTWSAQANQRLTSVMKAALPKGSTVDKAECRSSLCKVETHHASVEEFRAFVGEVFLDHERQAWNGGVYAAVTNQSEQGVTAVSYLAKEGKAVPLPQIRN